MSRNNPALIDTRNIGDLYGRVETCLLDYFVLCEPNRVKEGLEKFIELGKIFGLEGAELLSFVEKRREEEREEKRRKEDEEKEERLRTEEEEKEERRRRQ